MLEIIPAPIIAYFATVIVFFAIDFVWLAYVAKDFYHKHLGDKLADPFNLPVAAGFYLVYIIGIVVFAIVPALEAGSAMPAFIYGALFGFMAYATYDLTNLATLKDWPIKVTIVDMAWGTVITSVSAVAGYYLTTLIKTAV